MTKDEAIERLAKWYAPYNEYLGAVEVLETNLWASNFYAESLRDMTVGSLVGNGRAGYEDACLKEAETATHAMIERLTSE